jgi:two-component system response regulator MprA
MATISNGPERLALVVDDEPAVRGLVARLLHRQGWSVVQAADAEAALVAVGPGRFGLLVTDYDMPTLNGLDLAVRMRHADSTLPILMMSGHPEVAFRIHELDGGRAAFASKPFVPADFLATVEDLVSA